MNSTANELARAMALLDACMHVAGEQVDPGQQTERAVALVFVIAGEAGMRSRPRRQVGGSVADRLDARLFVVRDDRDVGIVGFALSQYGDLAINAEDFGHLC